MLQQNNDLLNAPNLNIFILKTEGFHIRNFEERDYKKVVELWDESGLNFPERGDSLEIVLDSIRIGGQLFVVENREKQIVATAWITFDGRRLHLHHVGVKHPYRGKGVGKSLVSHCIMFAKNKGYQLKLEVHRENQSAIDLFTNAGFKYLGDYNVYIMRDFSHI